MHWLLSSVIHPTESLDGTSACASPEGYAVMASPSMQGTSIQTQPLCQQMSYQSKRWMARQRTWPWRTLCMHWRRPCKQAPSPLMSTSSRSVCYTLSWPPSLLHIVHLNYTHAFGKQRRCLLSVSRKGMLWNIVIALGLFCPWIHMSERFKLRLTSDPLRAIA